MNNISMKRTFFSCFIVKAEIFCVCLYTGPHDVYIKFQDFRIQISIYRSRSVCFFLACVFQIYFYFFLDFIYNSYSIFVFFQRFFCIILVYNISMNYSSLPDVKKEITLYTNKLVLLFIGSSFKIVNLYLMWIFFFSTEEVLSLIFVCWFWNRLFY